MNKINFSLIVTFLFKSLPLILPYRWFYDGFLSDCQFIRVPSFLSLLVFCVLCKILHSAFLPDVMWGMPSP